ncbi:MAG: glycoside-pentoside-hexuronide (GPH):cation symporter [Lachnospiraceae bacterium]|nr:glycoside-pentoside-hexuronide (GPH):cation symporter [Lachnospiraceae bacterium]
MNTNTNDGSVTKGFRWRQRIGYGAMDLGRNIVQNMADLYLSVFLTTVAQLPLAAVSIMFLICKIIDAITDVIVGMLVDRTNTRFGRCRPWVVGGCFVYAIGLFALFQAPELSAGNKIVYMYAAYILYTLGMTMVNIPTSSMMPLLSKDPSEYNMFGSAKAWAASIASTVVANTAMVLVAFFGAGNNELLGYSRTVLLFGACEIVLCLIGVMMVKEINPPIESKKKNSSLSETLGNLKAIITDRNFLGVFLFCICNLIYQVATASTMAYYCLFILDHQMGLMGLAMTAQSVVGFACPVIFITMNRKFAKKNIVQIASVICVCGLALRYLSPSLPVMLIVGMAIFGIGMGCMNTSLMTMQPDVMDSLTVKTGKQLTGLVAALFSLGCQLGSGLSNSLVTAVLAIGGFDGSVQEQTASALMSVRVAFGGIGIGAVALVFCAMFVYNLDAQIPEIRKKIERMHQEAR